MTVKKYDQMRILIFVFMTALAYAAYLTMPYVFFMLSAGFITAIGMMLILLLGILDELVSIRKLKEIEIKLRR